MRLVKDTPLEIGWFAWQWRPGQATLTTVIKGTFDLVASGECPLSAEQDVLSGEVYPDDDPSQSPARDSDLSPFKPHGECFVLGSFHSPTGSPVDRSQIAFKIGSVLKNIAVIGDREWDGLGRPSEPAPFVSMPLRWERAFGGPGVAENPLGRGVAKRQGESAVRLPNLEDPQRLIQSRGDRPLPACSAPIPRMFTQRLRLAGTYDERWKRERYPHFPEDLQWEYFAAAPLDQRISGYFRGDEEIVLMNLLEGQPNVRCRLPGIGPRCLLVPADGGPSAATELELKLDTISVDAEAGRVHCLWRGVRDVPSTSLAEYAQIFVLHDEPGQRRSLDDCVRVLFAKLEGDARAVDEHAAEEAPGGSPSAPSAPLPAAAFESIQGASLKWAHLDQALTAEIGQMPPDALREMARLLEARGVSLDSFGGALGQSLKSLIEPEPAQRPMDEANLRAIEARVLREEEERRLAGSSADLRRRVQRALLEETSCRGWDLSGVDLSRLRISGGDFRGALFRRANLAGAIFGDTRFDGAMFEEAELSDASFHGASFADAEMHFCRLERAHFGDSNLDGSTITESFLRDARFSRSYGRKVELAGSHLERATFDDSVFDGADFTGATLDDALFARSSLRDARIIDGASARRMRFDRCDVSLLRAFGGVDFEESRFAACIAAGARFSGAKLGGVDLSFSDLDRADFSEALLFSAKLMGCRLRHARFDAAKLIGASLIRSDLYQARFEGADLRDADLRGANLFQAELWQATLGGAQLELADVSGTRIAR